jgi:phospholipid/cholesterol/gamma-HCH transport system permease protein
MNHHPAPTIKVNQDGIVQCGGAWTVSQLTELEPVLTGYVWPTVKHLTWDTSELTAMDAGGAVLMYRTMAELQRRGYAVTVQGVRREFGRLLERVGQTWAASKEIPAARRGPLDRLGTVAWQAGLNLVEALAFIGESASAAGRLATAPSRVRWRTVFRNVELDGVNALPITGLLTFLMGVVIAYQGAEQLQQFGANIFVVDLVGISLLREIAPIIVAILLAGRSGSAYAAEIGTMRVTEELDAIRTLGLSPIDLLVMPRVLALIIAMPMLTVYADALGVFGGMLIALSELNLSFTEFISRFEEAVALRHFLIGIGKAPFFALIIALVGCYQGFQIQGGVDQVGRRTTMSVVQSIFMVIVFDAFCSILFNWWDV